MEAVALEPVAQSALKYTPGSYFWVSPPLLTQARDQVDAEATNEEPDLLLATSPPRAEGCLGEGESEAESWQSPLEWGAKYLKAVIGQRSGHLKFVSSECSSSVAFSRVAAAAEASLQGQSQLLLDLCSYVAQLQSAGRFRALCFIEHVTYDETSMDIRVQWSATQHAERGLNKVYVVITGWSILLEDLLHTKCGPLAAEQKPQYLCLRAENSPQLRVAAATTGEYIRAILKSCFPVPDTVSKTFGIVIRLAESDEAGSNGRAEAITLSSGHNAEGLWHLHLYCMCHTVHACAQKSFSAIPSVTSGIVHASLQLGAGGAMRKVRAACASLAASHLKVTTDKLTPAAEAFRHRVLTLFRPRTSMRHRALVRTVAKILNGDWRQPFLEHRCGPGCCATYEESVQKVTLALGKLTTGLRPSVFTKGNWTSWSEAMVLHGLGGAIHGFLGSACLLAFHDTIAIAPCEREGDGAEVAPLQAGQVLQPEDAARDAQERNAADFDTDKVARLREERAKSSIIARSFWEGPYFQQVYLLRSALEGERALMASMLHAVSMSQRSQAMVEPAGAGKCTSPILALDRGHDIDAMFATTYTEFLLAAGALPECTTESTRSDMLRLFMRPLAVCAELVRKPSLSFPYRLFRLIDPQLDFHTTLESLLQAPACLTDPFSKRLLQSFVSQEMSTDALQQVLHCIAEIANTTTVAAERAHSSNLRRSEKRFSTHRLSLEEMGFSHVKSTAPRHMVHAKQLESKRRSGRPNKRTLDAAENCPSKQRRAGGGAWRAFCADNLVSQPITKNYMQCLARRYHELPTHEKQHYKELGKRGRGKTCAVFFKSPSSSLPEKQLLANVWLGLKLPFTHVATFSKVHCVLC